MIRRLREILVMRPEDIRPSRDDFIVIGVFNPGVVLINDSIVLLARVAERPRDERSGFTGLPRLKPHDDIVVDWMPNDALDHSDLRVVRRKDDNSARLTSISHLRVFRSQDGQPADWSAGQRMLPQSQFEEYGVEDPRITKIDERFWITYVAVSRHGAATALASTNDFETFDRHGMIFCPENKDVVLFGDKVGGQYASLHRPSTHFGRPQIWFARSPDLLNWGQHECVYSGSDDWENARVGAGAPPIATDEGWLAVYHGGRHTMRGGEVDAYSAGALLLDSDDPTRILKRSNGPIMQPTAKFERSGFVPNVVFPTALIEREDLLQMYYGAADSCIGVVEFLRRDVLEALR